MALVLRTRTAGCRALVGRPRTQSLLKVRKPFGKLALEGTLPDRQCATHRDICQRQILSDQELFVVNKRFRILDGTIDPLLQPNHRPIALVRTSSHEMS